MKAKFGAIVVDGRGKVGGHVFAKNKGGAYMRTKVSPSNPQTASQTAIRQALANFAQGFRALTASQIAAWNGAVGDFKKTDVFGDIKNPSGLNLYVKLNSNLREIGNASIAVPPLPAAVTSPTSISLAADFSAQSLDLTFAASPVPAGVKWIVGATAQQSPGVSAPRGKYRNIDVLVPTDTTPADIAAAYIAKFGPLVTGRKIFVNVTAVNTVTGQKSPALSTFTVVVA